VGIVPLHGARSVELKSPPIKTDLYALGCLAYELLAGSPPYTGDQAALRAGHLTQAPPEAPCGDVVLKSLIGQLIAKRPEDRPQDARAVLDRLRRTLVARGPIQESIARGLRAHGTEQARAAADQSAAQAAEDARRQQIAQAKADLREIVNDALSDLRAVEPDATSEERGTTRSSFVATPSFSLTAGGVRLRIDLWEGMTTSQPVQGDTMVLAGCVMITNASYHTELNSAHLIYERVDDRLAWRIYKFRSGLVPPERYPYGPYGRTYGLRYGEFFDSRERSFMLRPVMHVWSKTVTTLTAETLWNCSSRLSTSALGPPHRHLVSGATRPRRPRLDHSACLSPMATVGAVAVWRAGICGSDRTEFAVRDVRGAHGHRAPRAS
jgi:hypothetical protein